MSQVRVLPGLPLILVKGFLVMQNGKIVVVSYFAFFLVVLYFSVQFFDAVLGIRSIDLADYTVASVFPLKILSGFGLAAVIMLALWSMKGGKYRMELDSVVEELKSVVWPTKIETKVTTISVFVFTAIMVSIFFLYDLVLSNILLLVY